MNQQFQAFSFKIQGALCFLCCLLFNPVARAQVPITNNTLMIIHSDSYSRAQYGNRQNFFILSYYIFMHPEVVISPRDHSRSGGANWEMLTNRFQKFDYPEWGITGGNTNVVDFVYVSGNGGPNSNQIYTNFSDIVKAPFYAYAKDGLFTNDWHQGTNLFYKVIIGDMPLWAANGNQTIAQYSLGGLEVATENGLKYVDTFNNLVQAETNWNGGYPANSNLFFNPPNYDHPANEIQLAWALSTLHSLGEESNAFTAIFDWNNTTAPSQTNHCVASSLSQSGGVYTLTLHALRMGPGYYYPDASQTNDSTGGFLLMPQITNYICEIIRITNCPAGNYNVSEDGLTILTNVSSARLSAGINLFTDVHSGAMWAQKKECLGELCDMVNINRTNASVTYQPSGNTLIIRQESYANDRWPTNAGMANYIALMGDREAELISEDQIIHTNAQQTDHVFQFSEILPPVPRYAPAHR